MGGGAGGVGKSLSAKKMQFDLWGKMHGIFCFSIKKKRIFLYIRILTFLLIHMLVKAKGGLKRS